MDLRPLVDAFNYFGNIYKRNSTKTGRDYDLCGRYATISRCIVIGLPSSYFASTTLYHLATKSAGIMANNVKPSVYFPLLDHYGTFGSVLNHILDISDMYFAVITLFPYEITIYLVIANIMLTSAVISRDLDDLKVALLNPETAQQTKRTKLSEIIRSLPIFIE